MLELLMKLVLFRKFFQQICFSESGSGFHYEI